jgi:hypothetical protein
MSLDDDLAAWAATVRLPEADAAAIFERIVASAAGPAAPAAPAVRPVPPAERPAAPAERPAAPAERPVAPAGAPSLDPSWWRGYNAGFAARMVASTAPVRLAA